MTYEEKKILTKLHILHLFLEEIFLIIISYFAKIQN